MPGPKKAAHYSVPVSAGTPGLPPVRRAGPRALLRVFSLALLLCVIPCPGARAARPEADAKKAEAELQAVKAEIERITRQVSAEQVERDRLATELKSAELSVGKVRAALAEVRRERAERAARRAQLAAEKHEREGEVREKRAALAGQLRAAYLIGRQEPLKLLLNQKDPALAGRMFAYYSYFGRARAAQIHLIEENVARIAELEGELDAEDQELAELERQQRAQLHQLELSRVERSHVLASLEAQSHTRAQNLERLRSQQAGLEKLLRELRAAVERFPLEGNDAFTRLRGWWPPSGARR
jgi:septal ring factor EnvC (AmiA/AmiB activator)